MTEVTALPTTDPLFFACLEAAVQHPEFVQEYDRLTGSNLSLRGSGLDLEIDKASGRRALELKKFTVFVYEVIYLRVVPP